MNWTGLCKLHSLLPKKQILPFSLTETLYWKLFITLFISYVCFLTRNRSKDRTNSHNILLCS